ncbi:MAG: hypothetical protein AB8B58_04600 [Roseobacter sp.]
MNKAFLTLSLCCAFVLPAAAEKKATDSKAPKLLHYESDKMPPADYKGQWWTSPDQCQYSRAGRPGETVWYLIVNTAHANCAARLIQRAYSDYQ